MDAVGKVSQKNLGNEAQKETKLKQHRGTFALLFIYIYFVCLIGPTGVEEGTFTALRTI